MVSERMVKLGMNRNIMREIFEHGRRRAQVVGAENVLDFSLGNPSVPPPHQVNDTIRAVLESEMADGIHAYTSAPGDQACRDAIAASLTHRFGVFCTGNELYLTMGAAAALCCCISGLHTPGDEFVVVVPYFTEYRVFIESAGARVVEVPARPDSFDLDLEAMEAAIGPDTKAVLINSPNNPTGVVYPRQTIRGLAELLRRKSGEYGHPIYLISDEPYREVVYDGVEVPWLPAFYENTLVCYSYSKCLSIPGERVGYVLVPQSVEDWARVYAAVAGAGRGMGYINAPSLFQHVAAVCDGLTADLSVYKTNRELLYSGLTEMGYTCIRPDGTFYLLMKSPEADAVAFSRRAMGYDLLLAPTDSFGCPGWLRIAFCVETDVVRRALPVFRRLAEEYGLIQTK